VHVVPRIGGVQLQQVDGALLTRFYGDLLDSGRKRGNQSAGLKARTVRYIHTILSGALDDAVKWQRLVVNPATRATPPSAGESKAPEMRTWTGAQVRRFLDLCEGDRYAPAFAFLALTGCRRGEALGLRWSDVDLPGGTAAIRQSVIPLTKASGKGREGRIVARTKTDRARVIELDGATVATLRKWKATQAAEILAMDAGYQDHGLIFCRPDGLPHHPESFSTPPAAVRGPASDPAPRSAPHVGDSRSSGWRRRGHRVEATRSRLADDDVADLPARVGRYADGRCGEGGSADLRGSEGG